MAGSKGIVSSQFYKFSAANQTITFSNDYAGLDLGEITYITNIKNGVATVIYDPFDATKGGTLSGLTLTLAYNTTTMADTDPLQIITGFTPLNADPLPVTIVEGADQKDDTELLNRIADGIDFLNLSLDQGEGVPMNTRDVSTKRDTTGAIIPSDGVELPPKLIRGLNDEYRVDTTGYNTVVFTIIGDQNASFFLLPEIMMDGTRGQSVQSIAYSAGGTPSLNQAGSGFNVGAGVTSYIVVHSIFKFVRLRINTYTSGACTISCMLKNTVYGAGTALGPAMNVAQLSGTTPVAAAAGTTTTPTQGVSTAGTLSIAGAYVPTTNPPNAVTTLQNNVPFPIGIGGREQPYVGALSGVFRYLTVDGGGRYILGGDTPSTETRTLSTRADGTISGIPPRGVGGIPNNIVGAQSLTVVDTGQSEGDTNTMLLKQILQELKILNQQLIEIPFLLNNGESIMSDPQEYRNDNSTLF